MNLNTSNVKQERRPSFPHPNDHGSGDKNIDTPQTKYNSFINLYDYHYVAYMFI